MVDFVLGSFINTNPLNMWIIYIIPRSTSNDFWRDLHLSHMLSKSFPLYFCLTKKWFSLNENPLSVFFSIYSVINILSTHLFVVVFFFPKSTWDKINVIFKRSHVSWRNIANHRSLYLFLLSLSLCINFILLCNSPYHNPQSSVLLVKVLH